MEGRGTRGGNPEGEGDPDGGTQEGEVRREGNPEERGARGGNPECYSSTQTVFIGSSIQRCSSAQ